MWSSACGTSHKAYFPTADGSLYFRGVLKEDVFGQGKDQDRDTDETAQENILDESGPFLSEESCATVAELDPTKNFYQVEVEANVQKEIKVLENKLEVGKLSEESISLEGETVDTMQNTGRQKARGKKAAGTPEKQSSRLPLPTGSCGAWLSFPVGRRQGCQN